jgi:hypothetical protein
MSTERECSTATVTVEALPDPVPAASRYKRWLKLALRGFNLKAVDITPAPQAPAHQDHDRMEDQPR